MASYENEDDVWTAIGCAIFTFAIMALGIYCLCGFYRLFCC